LVVWRASPLSRRTASGSNSHSIRVRTLRGRFFPDGVRLKLVNERRFRHGVVVLQYAVRG
jgi:hypothetical protein